jgi:ribosome-binding factor A
VERDLHEQLASALGQLRDPRLVAVSVTRVQLTDDLQFARVFVHVGAAAAAEPDDVMRGLRSAGGRLRAHVSSSLALRRTPELRFIYDTGLDAAERVDELLAEIRDEQSEGGQGR